MTKAIEITKDWKVQKLILEGTRTNTTINTSDDKTMSK